MNQTIKCPNCSESIEITQALTSQISQDMKIKLEKEHKEALERAHKEHVAEVEKTRLEVEKALKEKLEKDQELALKSLKEEALEEKERNTKLLKQLEELNDEMRQLRRKDEERELEMKKKMADEEERIRKEALKKAEEEHLLKDREKDKKLQDALKQVEEMKRKIEQGSQQTQGEVLELELEDTLKAQFIYDKIEEIKKGQTGADVRQIVCSRNGSKCGVMLWETKNYRKSFNENWLSKLKADQRAEGANIAILVSVTLPSDFETDMGFKDGVWICKHNLAVPLATALRERLYEVARQKAINKHKGEKTDAMYEYITGTEFRQQVESLVEVYQEMMDQIQKERRTFESAWKRREQQLKRYLSSTAAICGNVQGIAGQNSVPSFKGLDMLELDQGE